MNSTWVGCSGLQSDDCSLDMAAGGLTDDGLADGELVIGGLVDSGLVDSGLVDGRLSDDGLAGWGLFVVVVVIFYFFSSQDAQANLPSRWGRDVPSSHKKRTWCDDRKKRKKEEKEETQPRAELEASMRKKRSIKWEWATRGTKMQRLGKIV